MIFSRRLSFVHLVQIRDVTSTDINCGNSIITKPMMRSELPQGRKTEPLPKFGIDGKTVWKYGNSQKTIGWNDELARYLDHIVQIDVSHDAPAEQRGQIQQFGESTWDRGKHVLFSVVINILVELTRVVFDKERMATTQLAG